MQKTFYVRCLEPWSVAKNLQASVAVPETPVWVPSQWPLAPSVMSVTFPG